MGMFSNAQPPNLPQAGKDYDAGYFNQLINKLRLYFVQLDATQPINIANLNVDTGTLPTDADVATLRDGDVYRDTAHGNALVAKTTGGSWPAAGSVSTVSVATAHGFAGTVATATTTPVITLTTSITGMLKGNGTDISAATLGTDYLSSASWASPGTIGSTTPNTGAFTTLSATGTFTWNGYTYAVPDGTSTTSFLCKDGTWRTPSPPSSPGNALYLNSLYGAF